MAIAVQETFRRTLRALYSQHLTVKIVPENASDAVSFRISIVVIIFSTLLLGSVVGGAAYLYRLSRSTPVTIAQQQSDLQKLQANLDEALQELQSVLRTVRPLQEELDLSAAGFSAGNTGLASPVALSRTQVTDFFQDLARTPESIQRSAVTTSNEVEELRDFVRNLENSLSTLGQTRALLATTDSYLRDVPHFWPVANGLGVVTMEYGPNIHPFTGQWYLHKGFDIAGPPGLPLVSAADGVVVDSSFDPGYGNNIIIRHRYGFHTRYAHLHQVFVREGQRVSQGERIGTLGSSGFSSGPHLHFEVIIGNDVLDPAPFLMISNTFQRGGHASSRRR
ncbi:MAG: M23 family metallopeptidase [Spirochaetaceae bacterium]|nr:MAG: M23 family metallopeptidase [Spirochaetaceae bacterium]